MLIELEQWGLFCNSKIDIPRPPNFCFKYPQGHRQWGGSIGRLCPIWAAEKGSLLTVLGP